MKSVAVIGLGIMGHGIVRNFLKKDHKVFVWNRTPAKADDLVDEGAVLANTVKEAVQKADMVFEVTADDESSKEIWLGNDGIFTNATPHQFLVTCATLSAKWTDELAAKCSDAGLQFFDMPMTGGRMGAESGELILLAGGNKNKLETIKPELASIAKDVKHFGKAGSGMRYKLILNALQAVHIIGLGETLRMANAAGLDENTVGEALAERPGGAITQLTWDCYKNEPDPINFSVEWIAKDLRYAAEMAYDTQHPLLDLARKIYDQAISQGHAQADWTKVNKL